MKKILVFFIMLFSLVSLTSCDFSSFIKNSNMYDDPHLQELFTEYQSLTAQKKELTLRLESLQNETSEYEEKYKELENSINSIDDLISTKFSFYNNLESETVKANILIYHKTEYVGDNKGYSDSGSGAVIKEDSENYYILTNNHVIGTDSLKVVKTQAIYCYDYLSNKYNATLLFNDANYDMALLSIKKGTASLRVLELATANPKANDYVISMGNPLLNTNCFAIGSVAKYGKVTSKSDLSTVSYDVIYHTAYIDSGSSGGALLDSNLKICGINTWKVTKGTEYSLSSPVLKIREFLTRNSFVVGE